MTYNFNTIEKNWQNYWAKHQTFKADNNSKKPKYYVLDMFPYPSGAGLHVGHPLGYIASDIYARYKRHKGFNVLHPQGYDSFGLPAEQYAIQTGQHPRDTTEINIDGVLDEEGVILKKFINPDNTIKDSAILPEYKNSELAPFASNKENYKNKVIKGYRRQLDQIGFSFDWSREVRTSSPEYYKWTQWIFIELFNSWYNKNTDKAELISELETIFSSEGNINVNAECDDDVNLFSAKEWKEWSSEAQQKILLKYRLTYLAESEVNWCSALGTVLANDEIVNGVSERGGHPVTRKKMTQWSMRISAYAERLRQGLDTIDWTESLKESQRNWIGKSVGASVSFNVIANSPTEPVEVKPKQSIESHQIKVFTTRPDTIFGANFLTLAPEHELVSLIVTDEQKDAVNIYIEATAKRSERDRMADVKTISGVFTGAYAEHPFTKQPMQIWIGDYVLASYGTGAVMAVPCGDQRDYEFANHFGIDIPNVFEGVDISEAAHADKDNTVITNSDFLNGLPYKKALKRAIFELEKIGHGEGKTNYRLRDAVFSRQRYWGEPFPVYYVNGMPQMIDTKHLPIQLPEVEKYLPTETGEPPLGRADAWAWDTEGNTVVSNDKINNTSIHPLELNTMPGWAGSSWYFFRYMEDTMRSDTFASKDALKYWENVDLYIGGSEHATGHLLYSRFWVKFLKDRNFVGVDEPFKKLINQGMILGTSAFIYGVWVSFSNHNSISDLDNDNLKLAEEVTRPFVLLISKEKFDKISDDGDIEEIIKWIKSKYPESQINSEIDKSKSVNNVFNFSAFTSHVDVSLVDSSDVLNIEAFKMWRQEFYNTQLLNDEEYIVVREVEKMSKSKYNVVNPDAICEQYGADSLRLYEMFLGPLEQAKPWNTAGITGVHSFLKKLWKLYVGENGLNVNDASPTKDNLKTLHKTIKKVEEDIENFSFNTSVSTFMIAVNELTTQKCTSKEVLEPLLVLISPYAPHIAEELYHQLGNTKSISTTPFPTFDASHLVESSKNYPISFNGKMRFTLELPMDMSKDDIEAAVMAHEKTITQLAGQEPKKIIVVPGKIVNIVG